MSEFNAAAVAAYTDTPKGHSDAPFTPVAGRFPDGMVNALMGGSPKRRGGKPGRPATPIDVASFQAAVDRAEIDGPLPKLGDLYTTLGNDPVFNVDGKWDSQQIMVKVRKARESGLTTKTQPAIPGRKASGEPKPEKTPKVSKASKIEETYREMFGSFANPDRLEKLLVRSRLNSISGEKAAKFLRNLLWLVEETPVAAVPAETELATA